MAHELGYSDEQQISHFVLCIPRGLYLYLKGAQTIPDAVENLRRGIALGGLELFSSNQTPVQDDCIVTSTNMAMKENKTQFTTDTLKAVRESIQDSMYDNNKTLGRIIDVIGDRIVNVIESLDSEPSLRDRNRERSNSRGRNHSRMITEVEVGIEIEIIPWTTTGIGDRGKSNSRNGSSGRKKHHRNEFCNFCDIAGHTTLRCFKLEDYINRKGKKIISHDEEEVQELAQAVQNLNLKLNSLKVRTSTNY